MSTESNTKGQPPMTSTPGQGPGPSDSHEPDDGDSPTAGADAEATTSGSAATADTADADTVTATAGHAGHPGHDGRSGDGPTERPSGWAQQQPPPAASGWAGWSAPGGGRPGSVPPQAPPPVPPPQPTGYSGPRWGPAAAGWQQQPPTAPAGWGWNQTPPVPKPGIIPLRPLGLGDILDGAIATLRLHWRALLGTTLAVGAVTQTINVVVQHQFVDDARLKEIQDNPDPTLSDFAHAFQGSMAASGITVLVGMVGTIVATSIVTMIVSRAVLGRPVSTADAWHSARPQLPRLLGLTILLPLVLVAILGVSALPGILVALSGSEDGGAALAVLGLPVGCAVAAWLMVQWSLASPALMLEKQGIVAAMKRSAKLVRGAWWRTVGVQLVSIILVVLTSSLISMPFVLIGAAVTGDGASSFFSMDSTSSWSYLVFVAIGGALGSAVTLPIGAGVTTLLYMDQRIRRESLDLELIRAAEEG